MAEQFTPQRQVPQARRVDNYFGRRMARVCDR